MQTAAAKLGGFAISAGLGLKEFVDILPADSRRNKAADGDIKRRIAAWWNGTEIESREARKQIEVRAELLPEPNEWTPERFRVVQQIWGEGFMEPGGAALAGKLLGPAKIDSKKTVLDLTVKLGGTMAAITKDANLWMEGFETHPELLKRALNMMNTMGLGSRITVTRVDYHTLDLPKRKYDVIYSRERLFSIADKQSLIEKIGAALKPTGQFLFTDYMAADPEQFETEIKAWTAAERHTVYPWTLELYKATLEQAGYSIWAVHDFSEEFLNQINTGWNRVVRELEAGQLDRKYVDYLMQEGEIWLARAKALESGALKIHRIQATSPAAKV